MAILVFVIALFGELAIDVFQPKFARRGSIMNIAIPLTINLALLGASISGKVRFRYFELSKSESPVKFFLTMAIAFAIANIILYYTVLTK